MSGWAGVVTDEIAQPGSRARKAGTDHGRAHLKDRGRLARLQALPDGEHQHLPVQLAETGERGLNGEPFGHLTARVGGDRSRDPLP